MSIKESKLKQLKKRRFLKRKNRKWNFNLRKEKRKKDEIKINMN
jgi:hypothetical protein